MDNVASATKTEVKLILDDDHDKRVSVDNFIGSLETYYNVLAAIVEATESFRKKVQ